MDPIDKELDDLLNQAKEKLSREVTVTDKETNDFQEAKETWRKLPKVESTLTKGDVDAQIPEVKNIELRPIVNPTLVKQEKLKKKQSNAGADWFGMKKTEMTPEIKRDLKLLEMRDVIDPKRHYRKEKIGNPKYFQTGTIIEGNTEFFSSRISRKDRRQTIADEILADFQANEFIDRKFNEIQVQKRSGKKAFYAGIQKSRHKY